MKYRTKLYEIETMQFTRDKINEIYEWSNGKLANVSIPRCIDGIMTGILIDDNEDEVVYIRENDYIVKDKETFKVYNKWDFKRLYEPVE